MNDRSLHPPESRSPDLRSLQTLLDEARTLARELGGSHNWRRVDRLEDAVAVAEETARRERRSR